MHLRLRRVLQMSPSGPAACLLLKKIISQVCLELKNLISQVIIQGKNQNLIISASEM